MPRLRIDRKLVRARAAMLELAQRNIKTWMHGGGSVVGTDKRGLVKIRKATKGCNLTHVQGKALTDRKRELTILYQIVAMSRGRIHSDQILKDPVAVRMLCDYMVAYADLKPKKKERINGNHEDRAARVDLVRGG